MEVHHNVSINKIAWLKIPNPGVIKNLFIPENRAELEVVNCIQRKSNLMSLGILPIYYITPHIILKMWFQPERLISIPCMIM